MTELTPTTAFAEFNDLADELLPFAVPPGDGAHDAAHVGRVFRNAMRIQEEEGGDRRVLAVAALLHDCVAVEKNSPQRAEASKLAAEKAKSLLLDTGWLPVDAESVAHAIESHSFSAGIEPTTLEARILQDADRLDAIGMVGVARCFYTAGRMKSALYDHVDPQALERPLDDKAFAIDHFPVKLLTLADGFKTEAGRRMAAERHARLQTFLDQFLDEI